MSSELYTIGYGNRNVRAFIQLLQKYEIDILVDVRTNPFSRYNPDFTAKKLELHLINNHIRYLFLGNELGGKPSELDCYTDNQVDYQKIQIKAFFKAGIDVLVNLTKEGLKTVIMCAEQSPVHCHRKSLIGDYMKSSHDFNIIHIDKDGSIYNELF